MSRSGSPSLQPVTNSELEDGIQLQESHISKGAVSERDLLPEGKLYSEWTDFEKKIIMVFASAAGIISPLST